MNIEQIGYRIIGCAIEAHRHLGGCGLLESVYEDALCYELEKSGLSFERQIALPVHYKDVVLASPMKIDLMVEKCVIIECKAVIQYNPVFEAQLLTYLRLSRLQLGYVINFGDPILKSGIHRVVNGLQT